MNCVLGKGIQKDSMSQNASSPGKIFSDEMLEKNPHQTIKDFMLKYLHRIIRKNLFLPNQRVNM